MTSIEMIAGTYRQAQRELAALQEEWRQRQVAMRAENADLLSAIDAARVDVSLREASLTSAALAIYNITGSKQPSEGVGIRVHRTPIITNVDDALAWAIEHRIGLTIDARRLTGAVAALGLTPDWLEITEETQVTISAELRGKVVADAR